MVELLTEAALGSLHVNNHGVIMVSNGSDCKGRAGCKVFIIV